jgi:hypothetical protein
MTNGKIRMTIETAMTNPEARPLNGAAFPSPPRPSSLLFRHSFAIRASSFGFLVLDCNGCVNVNV